MLHPLTRRKTEPARRPYRGDVRSRFGANLSIQHPHRPAQRKGQQAVIWSASTSNPQPKKTRATPLPTTRTRPHQQDRRYRQYSRQTLRPCRITASSVLMKYYLDYTVN